MVVFSKLAVISGTVAAQRDLFQVPVNPTFLSHTRPARPAAYAYGQGSGDVLMVAQPVEHGVPVYASPDGEFEDASQGWGWTAVLSAVAVGAVAGRAIGEYYTSEDTSSAPSQQYELAALAIAGHEAPKSDAPRSDPVMQASAAVDPDDDKFCYGMPGSISPFPKFDPLGLVEGVKRSYDDPKEEMRRRREAELTHGRVSMLASAGFLVQESFHPLFGGNIEGAAINQIPQLPTSYWAALVTGIWIAEATRISKGWADPREDSSMTQRLKPDYTPGDLGFDPFGLKPKGEKEFRDMQAKELSHGRLAMIAAAGFLAQETVTQQPWLATLAVKGNDVAKEDTARSDPVMQASAAVDPDDDKFCYGMPGSISPFPEFDPLGLVEGVKRSYDDPKEEMRRRREAELTHGRVSMLASAGFLVQESFHPLFGGNIEGAAINQIPQLPTSYWAALVTGIWIAEATRISKGWADPREDSSMTQRLKPDYTPGDLGFDPFGLKPKGEKEFRDMQAKELSHGRLAMIAAAGFLAQETVTQQPWFDTL